VWVDQDVGPINTLTNELNRGAPAQTFHWLFEAAVQFFLFSFLLFPDISSSAQQL
jgi:hypothetical protein